MTILEEAQQCLDDHSLWTVAACKRLIQRLATRIDELEDVVEELERKDY